MAGGNNKKRKADSMDVAASEAKRVQRNGRTVEIIPEADVTLRVGTGENALDIRASGLVLGLASKTFKAMLSSGFIEGTTKVIDLDEEPQTVLDFCHVIHYKYESVKSMGTERLCNLIVFADMRQCHEPLKPWLLYVLREYVAWFERLAADQFDAAQGYPDRYPGLRVEDFVHIAASFGLCDLFWLATRAYIAISKRTMMACGHRYLVDKLPLASGHDGLSLYELLDKNRIQHTQDLLKQAFLTIGQDFGTDDNCQVAREKFGTIHTWFIREGIDVASLCRYDESWWDAYVSLRKVSAPFLGNIDEDGGLDDDSWFNNCQVPGGCLYCQEKHMRNLRKTLARQMRLLPGACLRCFPERGEDSLCYFSFCWKPGHSERRSID